jgi:hypothetical protein
MRLEIACDPRYSELDETVLGVWLDERFPFSALRARPTLLDSGGGLSASCQMTVSRGMPNWIAGIRLVSCLEGGRVIRLFQLLHLDSELRLLRSSARRSAVAHFDRLPRATP